MKTVMKKMLSLMLVAVLLVSAVPTVFADVAATVPCTNPAHAAAGLTGTYVADDANNVAPTCAKVGTAVYTCPAPSGEQEHTFTVEIPKLKHSWNPATCTTKQTCKNCGGSTGDTLAHTPVADARIEATCSATGLTAGEHCSACNTVTVAQTVIDKLPHTEVIDAAVAPSCTNTGLTEGKHCSICGAVTVAQTTVAALGHNYGNNGICQNGCGSTETSTHEVYFSVNGNQNYWHLGVEHNQTVANPGHDYATDYTYLKSVKDTDTHEFMGWSKNPSATRGSDLEDIVLNPVTQSVTYYAIYRAKETTNSGSTDTGNGGSNNSGSNNSGSGSIGDDGLVKVHVTLHTGNTETATVELLRYKDASTRKIYASVAAHEDLIRAELAEKYPGYEWSGNVYDDPSKNQNMTETIGEGTTVYINAYTGQDMILIYVHKNRTFEPDRIIQMQGKKIGQTVTKSEVTKAVSKYYSVNSLSMYTEDDWEKLVNGKSVESASSIKVMDDDYFIIDVKISGSAKSTSGSGAKADSTNPKTGDAIFAPAMILGMSASALVVLYYLNKKRAF